MSAAAKRPLAYALLFLMTLTLLFVWYSTPNVYRREYNCYESLGNRIPVLQEDEPTAGQSIFFHETSCPKTLGDFPITPRQACAVESIARAHPDQDVFLLFVSAVANDINDTRNKAMQGLLTYGNIHPRHVNFESYVSNTPMKNLFAPLLKSEYRISHSSDILRYTTLFKFGGTYLDMDIIALKHLPEAPNYVGAESPWSLGAGVINFGADEVGLEMAAACANEISSTYNPKDWGYNGPGVISRVLQRRCESKRIIQMWGKLCNGYRIFPPSSFYAVSFSRHKDFFTSGQLEKVQKKANNSYLIHYWNKATINMKVDETVPFYHYAKQYCPKVFKATKGVF